jgi:two-component sensor histidine kinase
MVTSAQTQAIAFVFHEFVTHAAKYGALSGPNGRVSVSWDRTGAVAAAILTITCKRTRRFGVMCSKQGECVRRRS